MITLNDIPTCITSSRTTNVWEIILEEQLSWADHSADMEYPLRKMHLNELNFFIYFIYMNKHL